MPGIVTRLTSPNVVYVLPFTPLTVTVTLISLVAVASRVRNCIALLEVFEAKPQLGCSHVLLLDPVLEVRKVSALAGPSGHQAD